MDIVSGVASVSQLVEYSASATRYLIELHKAVQEGPTFCRDKTQEIRFLLSCINRVCKNEAATQPTDLEVDSDILPLYISITTIASTLLKLLAPRRNPLANHWRWLRKREQIKTQFAALEGKARLVQLYLAEKTYALVSGRSQSGRGRSKGLLPDLALNADFARLKNTSLGMNWALPLPLQSEALKNAGYLLKLNSKISPLSLASSGFQIAASR